jgi:hypothetical protein
MRRLTKVDFQQAAVVTARVVGVLTVCWGVIIFTPLLQWAGYGDPSRARAIAIALALEVTALMAFVTPVTELLKRWFDRTPS